MLWKALYTKSRNEKKVAERLHEAGIEYYLPLRKTLKQWSDRKKMVHEPLLPGYIFIKVNDNEFIRCNILNITGVVMFVRNLGKDAIIPEKEINTLKSIEKLGYEASLYTEPINEGDTVEIKHGVFKNLKAKVLHITNDGKVYAFILESINQNVKVFLPKNIVEIV